MLSRGRNSINLPKILEINLFVNLVTQTMKVDYIPVTDSGMGSSVTLRVAAVRVPSLPHGSVYSFLLLLQI